MQEWLELKIVHLILGFISHKVASIQNIYRAVDWWTWAHNIENRFPTGDFMKKRYKKSKLNNTGSVWEAVEELWKDETIDIRFRFGYRYRVGQSRTEWDGVRGSLVIRSKNIKGENITKKDTPRCEYHKRECFTVSVIWYSLCVIWSICRDSELFSR